MLGITNLISTEETFTATAAHALNSIFLMDGKLHRATAAIAIGDSVEVGTNCEVTSVSEAFPHDVQVNGVSVVTDGVANIPRAMSNLYGVVKLGDRWGIEWRTEGGGTKEGLAIRRPESQSVVKSGSAVWVPVPIDMQHESTFYGLAKAAGADMKDIANTTVGQYPDAQKEAIQSMLGITQMLAPTNSNLVASQAYSIGDVFAANGHLYKAIAAIA